MVIVGSKKMLIYDDTMPGRHIQIFDKGVELQKSDLSGELADYTTRLRTGDVVIPNIRLIEPLAVEIDHFADCIINDHTPLTDGRHGLIVTAVMEAMSHSMAKNGIVVPTGIVGKTMGSGS